VPGGHAFTLGKAVDAPHWPLAPGAAQGGAAWTETPGGAGPGGGVEDGGVRGVNPNVSPKRHRPPFEST
jgi:hypothetical protein